MHLTVLPLATTILATFHPAVPHRPVRARRRSKRATIRDRHRPRSPMVANRHRARRVTGTSGRTSLVVTAIARSPATQLHRRQGMAPARPVKEQHEEETVVAPRVTRPDRAADRHRVAIDRAVRADAEGDRVGTARTVLHHSARIAQAPCLTRP